ncbi:MAG: lipase family protein [Methylovirgula sp.]|uniref:lipase family protein n=1 Tax=Methylovirgula sp. TaxID=1978224 RepID=UPI003075F6D6
MTDGNLQSFSPSAAMEYGLLINAAYSMAGDPNNLTPPCAQLPPGFKFIAWVQMQDFILNSSTWRFYGLIVQRTNDPTRFVLAIRGTEPTSLEEWIDDITSVASTPLPGFGNVGYGFNRIFETMRVIEEGESTPTDLFAAAAKAMKPFTQQVAETVQKHAIAAAPKAEDHAEAVAPTVTSVEVTGHSLGSALATLYVAKNANTADVHVPRIYTFASPLVGDSTFVAAFDKLGADSWRIAIARDIVTHLPTIGFAHVDKVEELYSGKWVNKSVTCLHSMMTYLHLIHPAFPLDKGCAWDANADVGPNIGGHASA